MSKAQVNGVSLHYWRVGQGPDVVMLHGLIGNLAVWHLKIVPMMQTEFSLTTYDLRGHGYSEMPATNYTTVDMAADLLSLLDSLGIEKASLVGHSFGADIALHFSVLHPERVDRLVLIEPGLAALVAERKDPSWEGWRYWVRILGDAGIEVPPDKQADMQYLFTRSLETPKFYGPARGLPRKREPLIRLINDTTIVHDYEVEGGLTRELLAQIGYLHPTLLIYGANSHFLGTYRFLHAVWPDVPAILIEGGEHFGPLESPELLVHYMRPFLLGGVVPAPATSIDKLALLSGAQQPAE